MKKKLFTALFLIGFISNLCYGQKKPITNNSEILNNASIIDLHRAGLDDEIIISKVENSQTNFDLSTTKLIELKKAGISDAIIKSLMNKTNAGTNTTAMPSSETTNANPTTITLLNCPYYFNKEQNSFKPTEKVVATMQIKRKALGLGGTDFTFEIAGEHSNVRVVGDTVSFFLNTGGNALTDLVLYKLKVENNKRIAIGTRLPTGFAGFRNKKEPEDVISYNIILMKNGLYKITIPQRLTIGEYFFSNKLVMSETNTMNVFAFGID